MNPYEIAWNIAGANSKELTKIVHFTFEDKELECQFRFHTNGEVVWISFDECLELVIEKDDDDNTWILKVDTIVTTRGSCFDKQLFTTTSNGKGTGKGAFLLRMVQKFAKDFQVDKSVLEDFSTIHCDGENVSLKLLLTLKSGKTWYERFGYEPDFEKKVQQTYYLEAKETLMTYRVSDYVRWLIKDENISDIRKTLLKGVKGANGSMMYHNFLYRMYEQSCKKYTNYIDELLYTEEPVLTAYIQAVRKARRWVKYY